MPCFLGSGPNSGQSPVEWGEILSVCPSVRLSVHPPSLLADPQAPLAVPQAGPQAPLEGPQTLLTGPQALW